MQWVKKEKQFHEKDESTFRRDQSQSSLITNVLMTKTNMPIPLTIGNSLSETVNLIEFSAPKKSFSN